MLTARKSLSHFGSVANLRRADLSEIAKVVPRARAEVAFRHLHGAADNNAVHQ